MGYEKKYKEALERAKTLQKTCDSQAIVGWCEYLFPELKESEDERIRIEVINYFTEGREFLSLCSFGRDEIIAWLEKQGKHIEEEMNNSIDATFDNAFKNISKENNDERIRKGIVYLIQCVPEIEWCKADVSIGEVQTWLEKQGEKEYDWSEESDDDAWLNDIISKVESGLQLNKAEINWLKSIKDKLHKEIHYWTEEEIEPIISDYLRGTEHYGGMIGRLRCLKPKSLEKQGEQKEPATASDLVDKTKLNKANPNFLTPQEIDVKDTGTATPIDDKPAEWSEEDEVAMNRIVSLLENFNVADNDILLKDIDWLKSLKSRVKCADVSQQPDKIISEEVKHINAMDILLSDIDVDAMVEEYKSKSFMPPLGDLSHYDFYVATMCSVYRQGILDTLYQLKTK